MLGLDYRAARYTWTVVSILLLLALLYLIRETLFIFAVALLFAYLLWPLVKFLDQRAPGRSKVWALALVYLSLVALLIVIGAAVGSRIAVQANALATKVPELISKIDKPATPVASSPLHDLKNRILSLLRKQVGEHSQDAVTILSNAALGVLSHAGSLMFIVLVPILSFFFLKDGDSIRRSVLRIVASGPQRQSINEIAVQLNLLLVQYMRALVLLAVAAFLAYGLFFSLIGVPYGILLAAIAFPLEFIPMVGPFAGAIIILAVAGLGGFHHLLWIVGFLVAFRIFQDYVLSPRLLSEGMELHPLLVIFGVLAGGSIAGVAGSFLSVPILATLRIIFRQLQSNSRASRAYPGELGIANEILDDRTLK
jgi:predicted PurR-regulated permease PerM